MQLLTPELKKRFADVGDQSGKGKNAIVIAKFFHPLSNWTWYATEYNPHGRTFFGFVRGVEDEWGYFSLDEMKSVGDRTHIGIERDLYCGEKTLKEHLGEG